MHSVRSSKPAQQGSDGLSLLRSARPNEGILPFDLQIGVWSGADAGTACLGLQMSWRGESDVLELGNRGEPNLPELRYLTSKLAALMPFGKVADFLGELLPASAKTNANTLRNRMMRVGRRLERSVQSDFSASVRDGI